MPQPYRTLFLCTANSARSILAEALLNHAGARRFQAFSAGSHPGGVVNPLALEILGAAGIAAPHARSKSWDEFAAPGVDPMDFVITVCDNAAGEVCPIWPGHPITAHWGIADPAAVEGAAERQRVAFRDAATKLRRRIELLTALPVAKLDRLALQSRLREIGRT